jgi:hypothetical protein
VCSGLSLSTHVWLPQFWQVKILPSCERVKGCRVLVQRFMQAMPVLSFWACLYGC